jgi:hypothetical protein
MRVPVGTMYRGTGKQQSVGTVHQVLPPIRAAAGKLGKGTGLQAKATYVRLTTAAETTWLAAADSFCH